MARIELGQLSPRVDTMGRLLRAAGYTLEVGPQLGIGVDETLIREYLSFSPEERVARAGVAAGRMAALLASARRPGPRETPA